VLSHFPEHGRAVVLEASKEVCHDRFPAQYCKGTHCGSTTAWKWGFQVTSNSGQVRAIPSLTQAIESSRRIWLFNEPPPIDCWPVQLAQLRQVESGKFSDRRIAIQQSLTPHPSPREYTSREYTRTCMA
jgi:hypothetical protein